MDKLYLILAVIPLLILLAALAGLMKSCKSLMLRNDSLCESIDNLCKLNDRLRMDRHDYLNHLQVIYGLMELEEYDDMNAYLRKVYKDLLKTGKAIKTSKPALNALLAAKMAEAESKDMEFLIEVKSDLKDLRIEDWELCKLLSNLIDNAMNALAGEQAEEKKLRINITETAEEYLFEVEDNGPQIPGEIREAIFKKGFSTQKGEGHGMGLAIVSEILEKNGGSILLQSKEEETVFSVKFRKGV